MFVITYRKIFYFISLILIGGSIAATATWGINFGIDFTGGSILEIKFPSVYVEKMAVESTVASLNLEKDFSIRQTGEHGYILKSRTLSDAEKDLIISALSTQTDSLEEVRFNTVGPTLGSELQVKAFWAGIVVVLAILIYVAIAFSQVSKPVSSWKYGFITILTFIHDVSVPIGLFSFLGRFYGVEVDTLFIIAILVVLGYSVNDTIIVFDRIRENLKQVPEKQRDVRFTEIVGTGLRQTFGRSINTSLTTLISLVALVIFGGEATRWFSLALVAGIAVGTYSSIFFASPMLVTLYNLQNKSAK